VTAGGRSVGRTGFFACRALGSLLSVSFDFDGEVALVTVVGVPVFGEA